MESVTIYVENKEQVSLLTNFLKHLDFVIQPTSEKQKDKSYDFFKSAGLWENRTITQENLREKAWKRS